jgi:hypothetical protein
MAPRKSLILGNDQARPLVAGVFNLLIAVFHFPSIVIARFVARVSRYFWAMGIRVDTVRSPPYVWNID